MDFIIHFNEKMKRSHEYVAEIHKPSENWSPLLTFTLENNFPLKLFLFYENAN